MRDGRDVHVLGYFIDPRSTPPAAFLAEQRQRRLDRVRQMIERLAALGIVLDADAILQPGDRRSEPKAAGRPWIARALVAGGHVGDDRRGVRPLAGARQPGVRAARRARRPTRSSRGFTRRAASRRWRIPVSLTTRRRGLPVCVGGGPRRASRRTTPSTTPRRRRATWRMARRSGVAVTGGSDYHGDPSHGAGSPWCRVAAARGVRRLARLRQRPARLDARRAAMRATASGEATSSSRTTSKPSNSVAQFARLEQVIGRRRTAPERALVHGERLVHDEAARPDRPREATGTDRAADSA